MIGGISVWQLLILLLIVVLVFGTKRLRNIGSDLGSAIKGFRKGMEDDSDSETADPAADEPQQIGAEAMPSSTVEESTKENNPAERPPGTDV